MHLISVGQNGKKQKKTFGAANTTDVVYLSAERKECIIPEAMSKARPT